MLRYYSNTDLSKPAKIGSQPPSPRDLGGYKVSRILTTIVQVILIGSVVSLVRLLVLDYLDMMESTEYE
jgi:hypothetical protein